MVRLPIPYVALVEKRMILQVTLALMYRNMLLEIY